MSEKYAVSAFLAVNLLRIVPTTLSGRNFLSKGAISGDLIFIAWTKL